MRQTGACRSIRHPNPEPALPRRLFRIAAGVPLLLALAACTAVDAGGPATPCAPGAVVVGASAGDLQRALDAAGPGDVLQLRDATYEGSFTITRSGTADEPITLCGGTGAVLDGGGTEHGYVLHLDGADFWVLEGFTVTNGQKGIMLDAANDNVLRGLTVHDTGHEGVHLRTHSSGNLLDGLTVRGTGRTRAEFGEGIYIGSAESNWCRYTACEPDRSDDNTVVGARVSDAAAEAVDIKEGTSGGTVRDSELGNGDPVRAVIDVKGNDWMLTGNVVRAAGGVGIEVHTLLPGWGERNTFAGNAFRFPGHGVGIVLSGTAAGAANTVACDQDVASGSRVTDGDCADSAQ